MVSKFSYIFVKQIMNLCFVFITVGNFVNCILEANHSAQKLLEIISENFFHFRDESMYRNQTGNINTWHSQCFFNTLHCMLKYCLLTYFINGFTVAIYKRAQILIADIWSSFRGSGFGKFYDIDTLTMFADYR